jgi:hypothetical protein
MSFSATTEQVRNRTKTVTRRQGWLFLNRGDIVQPVVKAQGLKKGERVVKIGGPIRIKSNRRVGLDRITKRDCIKEGFPNHSPREFVRMYCRLNGCTEWGNVSRIEFEYVD